MKSLFIALALMTTVSASASELVSSAQCFQANNEEKTIEILVEEEMNTYENMQRGLPLVVVTEGRSVEAVITQVKGNLLLISLADGQKLEFDQANGKTRLNSKAYHCSNALGF